MNKRGGQAFLDTGTTFVYVSKPFFGQIASTFNRFCKQKKANCGGNKNYQECYRFMPFMFKNDDAFMSTFPVFEFHFEGDAVVKWFPQDYFVGGPENEGYKCIGIKVLKDMILGALFMRDYDVSFEKSGKAITFVRSNCGKSNGFIPTEGLLEQKVKVDVQETNAKKSGEATQDPVPRNSDSHSEVVPSTVLGDSVAVPIAAPQSKALPSTPSPPPSKQPPQPTGQEVRSPLAPDQLKALHHSRFSKRVSGHGELSKVPVCLLTIIAIVLGIFGTKVLFFFLHSKYRRSGN